MQQVIYPDGKLSLPIGWAILRKGAQIKKGDKYFNWDKKQWSPVTAADCTTVVWDLPDIVIRKRCEPATDFHPDTNYQPEVTNGI